MNSDAMRRLMGGPPGTVILKFVLLSILVGAVLAAAGLSPENLLYWIQLSFRELFGYGFDALHNAFRYFLYGAVIVGPIWLLTRLMSGR
jgi:hypothetical protein